MGVCFWQSVLRPLLQHRRLLQHRQLLLLGGPLLQLLMLLFILVGALQHAAVPAGAGEGAPPV